MLDKNKLYEELSAERKRLQAEGKLPQWMTTMGWQIIKNKDYLWEGRSLNETFAHMAAAAGKHLPKSFPNREYVIRRFYEIMYDGDLGPSTPVFNLGTPKGFPISCSGNDVPDSIYGFYASTLEAAMLTKEYFGTSSYLGNIRPRGSKISRGGTAQGAAPVFDDHVQVMRDVTQGTARRGSWAGYIDVMSPDFDEIIDKIYTDPDDRNIGINWYDQDMINLADHEPETLRRFQKQMKLRAILGKGYFYFPDRVARLQPQMYADLGLRSLASNLCAEITLHADDKHSFTCVLSSMNLARWDVWKDTDAVYIATIFLDCIISEFLDLIKKQPKDVRRVFKKVERSTRKSRALGLGVMGFHTLLQEKMIPFESVECAMLNDEIFKHIHDETLKASQFLAKELGEPEWCKGYGVRHTHRTSLPPTMSSSQICGTVSQSIEALLANTFQQKLAGGSVTRINPTLMRIMQERGVLTQELIDEIGRDYDGSVQHVDWLNDLEKQVFKTAYEIDPKVFIDLADDRQPYICQAQSLNLPFKGDASEEYIADVHQYGMFKKNIKSLYYMRSQASSKGSSGKASVEIAICESCTA